MLRLVLMGGARLGGIGIAAGLLLSLWLTKIVAAQLYAVSRMDAVGVIGPSALLFGVVVVATFVPAYRAMRIDPIAALRHE